MSEKVSLDLPSRQRSCVTVNTPSACVNKAIYHIQDLEGKVEKSVQQYDHLYSLKKISGDLGIENLEEAKKIWLSVSSELRTEQSLHWEEEKSKDFQPLKEKTRAVLTEVIQLVTRLEDERRRAEEALEIEKRRRKRLFQNADSLSLWRLKQLPIAVQAEWEKCSQDVTELQWHLEEKNQQLQDAINQLSKADIANANMLEQINFMKKHSPLLGEKLSYEEAAVEEIKKLFQKTKSVYDIVHQKLLEVQSEHQELTDECERERKFMSNQIHEDQLLLESLMNQLKQAEALYIEFCKKIKETKEAISQKKDRLEELIKQEADTKADLMSWQDKVNRLTSKIAAQEKENRDLLNEYFEKMKHFESSKSTQRSDLEYLKNKIASCLDAVDKVKIENKALQAENTGYLQKFRESARRKVGYHSEIQVLLKNIRRLEDHLRKVNKEMYEAELAYDEMKEKLEELEKNIAKAKLIFKNLEENITMQIKEEVSAWKLTQKRVRALQAEIEKQEKEFLKMEEKIKKKLFDLDQRIAEEKAMLDKNRETQKEYAKKIARLNQQIAELEEKEKKRKKELDEQLKCIQDLLSDLKEKYSDVSSQLDKVNENIMNLQRKITKLNELSKGKQNQNDKIEKSIVELREKYARIKVKEQNAQTLVDFLLERLNCALQKVRTDGRVLEDLLWNRQKDLKTKQVILLDTLDENLRLAQEYQMLQICFLKDKSELMDFCDIKVRAEASLRDQQQLSQLQRKLHKVLVEYFKLRARYSQAGLAKFQAASQENFQKILAVQAGLSSAVQHTSTFLESLTDGSST